MAYSDISLLANDQDFTQRTAACATVEGKTFNGNANGIAWAGAMSWQMAASPGFGDKYASALAAGVPRPGWDQSVISDGDILSAVQGLPDVDTQANDT